jgi:hypothetical protein
VLAVVLLFIPTKIYSSNTLSIQVLYSMGLFYPSGTPMPWQELKGVLWRRQEE